MSIAAPEQQRTHSARSAMSIARTRTAHALRQECHVYSPHQNWQHSQSP
jgi:hypothetical protein